MDYLLREKFIMKDFKNSGQSVVCEALEPRLLLSSAPLLDIEPLDFANVPANISVSVLPDIVQKQDDGVVSDSLRKAREAIEICI